MLVASNAYWLYALLDSGISYTYLEASHEMSEKMLTQTTRLANMGLLGLPAVTAIKRIGLDAYGLEPFEKEGCIYASHVCVRLNEDRVVVAIGDENR